MSLTYTIVDGPSSPDSQNNQNSTEQTNGHLSNDDSRDSTMASATTNTSSGKITKTSLSRHKKGKNKAKSRFVIYFYVLESALICVCDILIQSYYTLTKSCFQKFAFNKLFFQTNVHLAIIIFFSGPCPLGLREIDGLHGTTTHSCTMT